MLPTALGPGQAEGQPVTPGYRAHCRAPYPSPKGLTQEGPEFRELLGTGAGKKNHLCAAPFPQAAAPSPQLHSPHLLQRAHPAGQSNSSTFLQ